MEQAKNLRDRNIGLITFFLSGICVISSGIVVNLLQEMYGFSYGTTGTLLSFMSIGNMVAAFLAGILPRKIGIKATVTILTFGYLLGYGLTIVTGAVGILITAFLLIGLAKGCVLNHCTILVGNNSDNRAKGLSFMHSCYAAGALSCPFLINALKGAGNKAPLIALASVGAVLWLIYLIAEKPEKAEKAEKAEKQVTAKAGSRDFAFLKNPTFWILTALVFCQNAAETSVVGWLVTYYKNQGILSGTLSTYTVTIMWGATLIARLLISFVFPVRNIFRFLTISGIALTIFYALLVMVGSAVPAVTMLFLFAFAMAGVNPIATAGVGRSMSAESMAVLLPTAGIGAIVMPAIIGFAADAAGLRFGMSLNLIPCAMIFVLSFIMLSKNK